MESAARSIGNRSRFEYIPLVESKTAWAVREEGVSGMVQIAVLSGYTRYFVGRVPPRGEKRPVRAPGLQ